jgi:hypothetical protein
LPESSLSWAIWMPTPPPAGNNRVNRKPSVTKAESYREAAVKRASEVFRPLNRCNRRRRDLPPAAGNYDAILLQTDEDNGNSFSRQSVGLRFSVMASGFVSLPILRADHPGAEKAGKSSAVEACSGMRPVFAIRSCMTSTRAFVPPSNRAK